jgi:phosphatidylglycerol---prolipoprotein diacylglyceryl transferase
MFPELFKIPFLNFSVHSYGLMLVIGLLLAMELAKFLARRSGLNPDFFATASVLALVSGLIGARIAYVIQFNQEFRTGNVTQDIFNAVNITSGGLVYYGGFLVAFATLVIYACIKKIPIFRGMDIIAPCLMIGLAMGRVGCFLNGCCYGQPCELPSPLGVTFPYYSPAYVDDYQSGRIQPDARLLDFNALRNTQRLITPEQIIAQKDLRDIAAGQRSTRVINTQLISTVTALFIAAISYCIFTLGLPAGRGFAVMMMLEGISRTLIERLRVEPAEVGSLTLSMFIGIGVALGGVILWLVAGKVAGKKLIAV